MIKQVGDFGVYTDIRKVPVGTAYILITQRTHLVVLSTITHLHPVT